MPASLPAAASASPSRVQTGRPNDTWATRPVPKKLLLRATVRSMNWSTSTKLPGGRSMLRLPTAESEIRSVTPERFSASILARKLISEGGSLWPRPWRGRNTTSVSPSLPKHSSSEGSPKGDQTWRHSTSMMPITAITPVWKAAPAAATGIVGTSAAWENGRAMRRGVGLWAIALTALLGAVTAPEARALMVYTHESVMVPSTTDGVPQDLPTELYKPEGAGPFPAIVML